MTTEPGDLRTRRTRLALRNALLTLIDREEFEAITVQDIAGEAMINRVTFYKHYTDKYALLDAIVREMLSELTPSLDILLPHADDEAVYHAIVHWLEEVALHPGFYRMVLGNSGNTPYSARLMDTLETLIVAVARRHFGSSAVEASAVPVQGIVSIRFIAAGFLGVTNWWLAQKKPAPVHEVAKYLHHLLSTSVQSAVALR